MLSHHKIISTIINESFHSPGQVFNSFLELGISNDSSVCQHLNGVDKIVAVDIVDNIHLPSHVQFTHASTDRFFKLNREKFDAIFIDADHKVEQVIKDLNNSLQILNKGGIIFIHDTDPITKAFTRPGRCNDSWKVVEYIRSRLDIEAVTLPITSEGLTIVTKVDTSRVDKWQR
jgi:hypothetical protein